MIPNHFCVILDKTSFSEAKLLGFYGKISKKNYNKSKGFFKCKKCLLFICNSINFLNYGRKPGLSELAINNDETAFF